VPRISHYFIHKNALKGIYNQLTIPYWSESDMVTVYPLSEIHVTEPFKLKLSIYTRGTDHAAKHST
jgi:hypothetical protein